MAAKRTRQDAEAKTLSASQRVEQHIKQAIYRGRLKPRERIIEEELARSLNCSRGPVREALLRLERDGLIVTIPRRGTFIRDITEESIDVVFHIRGKLEGLCVRYMRASLDEDAKAALADCLKGMKDAALKADEEEFLQADMRLHQTIWKLSRREQLVLTLNTVMNPFIFMVARAYSSQTPVMQRYREHEEYVDMILTAPVNRVERLVEQYFERLHQNLFSRNFPVFLGGNGRSLELENAGAGRVPPASS
jgi:DNA-binding GntR family transcriptional regulator